MNNIKEKRGLFVVVDGIDGIGKGEIERALMQYEQKLNRAVFDSISFSRASRKALPELKDFWNPPETYYDTIVTAEPTYAGIGHVIRNEIIALGDRKYSFETQIEAYALDRLISMARVVIPALKNGLRVIQSRSVASTLVYQTIKAEEAGHKNAGEIRKKILSYRGNALALEWAPDLLIIPIIKSMPSLMRRIEERKKTQKDDRAIFDDSLFLRKANALYASTWLKTIFLERGTTVRYLNAGISPEATRQQAINIYKEFLESCHLDYS